MKLAAELMIERSTKLQDPESLAAIARSGDDQALSELLAEIRPLVYRWAWMQAGDMDVAEDIAQTVLLRVSSRITAFDGRSKFETWLYRVTHNVCIEHHRRTSSWTRLLDRWTDEARGSERVGDDTLNSMGNAQTVSAIRKMMLELTVNQRAAIDLVDFQGYEPMEAARMLDMNPATLRTHLSRGRTALRGALMEGDQ